MKTMRRWVGVGFVWLAAAAFADAQGLTPSDVSNLVRETSRQSVHVDRPLTIQWMPVELWTEDATIPADARTQLEQVLAPYVLIVLIQPSPTIPNPYSEGELRELARLVDAEGNSYSAVLDDELSPEAGPVISALGGAVQQMAPPGANVLLLPFPNERVDGTRAFPRARESGSFSLRFADEEVSWRLPLNALQRAERSP